MLKPITHQSLPAARPGAVDWARPAFGPPRSARTWLESITARDQSSCFAPGAWRHQSSARICVEHTNAELRQWAPLRRFTGRREIYEETHLAIAGLVSDRSAQRPTRRRTSTALILVRNGAC
ncbi:MULTISPECIES: hypothetical protein [unclassified Streptomyces]|uniref:hypothetical protein n=1 Tax=unclassified Streptomyces TaxID=2593676 RepID=UPI0033A2D0E3